MQPRLSLVQHLAMYTAFHQAPRNRALHAAGVPLVLFTALVLFAYVGSLGTVLSALTFVLFMRLDVGGAAVLSGLCLTGSLVASALVNLVPAPVLIPLTLIFHGLAWYLLVVVGHLRHEPMIETPRGPVDSNEYFRRGLFLAKNTGVQVSFFDKLIQFSISPLAATHELFEVLGLRGEIGAQVAAVRAEFIANGLHLKRPASPSKSASHVWTTSASLVSTTRTASGPYTSTTDANEP